MNIVPFLGWGTRERDDFSFCFCFCFCFFFESSFICLVFCFFMLGISALALPIFVRSYEIWFMTFSKHLGLSNISIAVSPSLEYSNFEKRYGGKDLRVLMHLALAPYIPQSWGA